MFHSLSLPVCLVLSAIAVQACSGASHGSPRSTLFAEYGTAPRGFATVDAKTYEALECRCGLPQFLSLPHANITPAAEARKCANYKLLDARGTNEPQGISTMFYPMIHNILLNVTNGTSLPVEYPAAPEQNTTSGENFVVDTIVQGMYDCPDQRYALFGYSQGATLMLRALRQLDASALELIKSVILVGNPYRLPGKISNVNATAQHDQKSSVGMFAEIAVGGNTTIPQLTAQMDRSGKVLDYCLEGDLVCSPNPACNCQLPAGHLSYSLVDTVQQTAYEHVVSRLISSSD